MQRQHDRGRKPRSEPREYVRQLRLPDERQVELVEAYLAGAGTEELAAAFDLHRATVNKLLRKAGVLRPTKKLTPADAAEAVRLREAGWLYREIAERFDVDTETARRYVLRPSRAGSRQAGSRRSSD